MSKGYGFMCSRCGYMYQVTPGVGMLYPIVFKRTLDEIKSGKYGVKMMAAAKSRKYVAVDAENYVFICDKCGFWKEDMDRSLYTPKDPEYIAHERFGEKTVEEWGEIPYACGSDFDDYDLIYKRRHICKKCGSEMHKASKEETENLKCPKCGGEKDPGYISYICCD